MCRNRKATGYIVQQRNYRHYFVLTFKGVLSIKILSYYAAHMKTDVLQLKKRKSRHNDQSFGVVIAVLSLVRLCYEIVVLRVGPGDSGLGLNLDSDGCWLCDLRQLLTISVPLFLHL